MAKTNVNPYDIQGITDLLASTKQDIGKALEAQNTQMEAIQSQIQMDIQKSEQAIAGFQQQVSEALQSTPDAPSQVTLERQIIDINSIVEPMRKAVEQSVTDLRNSYNSQIQVQAKQLDAAVGAGAFGGNSFRAQQTYQTAMNQMFNKTTADIAGLTLSAEQQIMSTVSELSSFQAQLEQAAGTEEARLNVEQSTRYREMVSNREVQLLGLMGNVAQMTIEAGAVMTGNWLNVFNINNNSMNQLIRLSSEIDLAEVGVRQQLARDVFGAEMQVIQNNAQIQIAYYDAVARVQTAQAQASAARDQARTQRYIGELNKETNIRLAELEKSSQREVALIENRAAVDLLNMLGTGNDGTSTPSQNIDRLVDEQGFTRIS
jgi:hypothetical protein